MAPPGRQLNTPHRAHFDKTGAPRRLVFGDPSRYAGPQQFAAAPALDNKNNKAIEGILHA